MAVWSGSGRVRSERMHAVHVEAGAEGRVDGRAALLEAAESQLGAIGERSLRAKSLMEKGSATHSFHES